MTKMTDKEMDYILSKFIENHSKCRTCQFIHCSNDIGYYCFFAAGCYKGYSFEFYTPKKEEEAPFCQKGCDEEC